MQENRLISPGRFTIILSILGLVLSSLVITFSFFGMGKSFAMNNISIDYENLRLQKPTDKIQLFFNKGVDVSYREGQAREANGNVDFRDVIIEKINNASKTIDLAVMYLEDESVIEAIKQAHTRGVKIRVITDHVRLEIVKKLLKDTSIEVIDNKGGIIQEGYKNEKSIMHYKFGLFDANIPDQAYLITTSANWTEKDFDRNANNLVMIQDQPLVLAYLDEFEQMWSGKFNRDKDLSKHRGEVFEIDGRFVELWMSPSADPFTSFQMRFVNLFNQAKKSIYFATFNFTLPRLSQELETKFKEGIDFKGVANVGSWDINGSVLFDMRGVKHIKYNTPWTSIAFENIRHDALVEQDAFHYKYFIIDEEIVITGASNPTVSAVFTNDEDLLIIHDPLIANEFKQNFFYHFKEFGGLTRDSIIKIADFDDENDAVILENISDRELDIQDWEIVAVRDVYSPSELSPKNRMTIEQPITVLSGATVRIELPEDFLTNNNENDKFPFTNTRDDGEIYLFDNFDLLQHMIWY